MATIVHLKARKPVVSIIVPSSESRYPQAARAFEYLSSLGRDDTECLIVQMSDGEFNQTAAYNAGAKAASGQVLVFTCAGVWWPDRVIALTRAVLETYPGTIVLAMRCDEQENGGWAIISQSFGEWQAMTKETFESVGRFDESMRPAQYHEWDFLVRAYLSGHRIGLLEDRVWHSWHANCSREEHRAHNARNRRLSAAKGLPLYFGTWPNDNRLIWPDGREEAMNVDVVCAYGYEPEAVPLPGAAE